MLRDWVYNPEPETGTYVKVVDGTNIYYRANDGYWYNVTDVTKRVKMYWSYLIANYKHLIEYIPEPKIGDTLTTKEELDRLPVFTVVLYDEPVPMPLYPNAYTNRTAFVRAPTGGWMSVNSHAALGFPGSIYNSERLAELGRKYPIRILSLPAVVSE